MHPNPRNEFAVQMAKWADGGFREAGLGPAPSIIRDNSSFLFMFARKARSRLRNEVTAAFLGLYPKSHPASLR
jgi:hypothetical protein